MQQSRESYMQILRQRADQILQLWDQHEQPWRDLRFMRRMASDAHRLAGSSATLGFARLAKAAAALEAEINRSLYKGGQPTNAELPVLLALQALREASKSIETEPLAWAEPLSNKKHPQLLRKLRLLFVEDSGDLAVTQRAALLLTGAEDVQFCPSVTRAKAYLTTGTSHVHIVLIDYHLGHQYGSTLACWMQTQPQLAAVLRVSYSATSEATIRSLVQGTTYHAFITKPIDLQSLIQRIATLHQQTLS